MSLTAYAASVSYVDGNGTSQTVDATELESTTTSWTDGSWYIVPEGGLTISGRIAVSGTVNLILRDGTELTASAGITTTGATLNIYAQSTGTGALTATGANGANHTGGNAGIGGIGVGLSASGGAGGTVNIYGGTVTATGGNGDMGGGGGAGIGGGGLAWTSIAGSGAGGTVNIYGGTVTATGGTGGQQYGGGAGAGIGRGANGYSSSAGADGTLTLGVGVKLYNGTDNTGTVLDDNDSESRNYSGSRPQNMYAEVTVAAPAASTYTVTLKEGTEDATSWTIAPAEATTTGVAAGTEVKATYGGTKKVKSVKAVKKAADGTITAQLAAKLAYGNTTDGLTTMTWAVGEHIAILYKVSGTKKVADAAVDGTTGAATIQFTVEDGTPDNTPCTLVYPYSAAKDDHTGVKDAATLLAAQDGTLSANLDVRVGAGTIQTTTPGLTVTTQPKAQFAIFKFTTKNANGSATIDVNSLTITIGAQNYVITPALATSELYVALPAVADEAARFSATGSDSKTYTCSKASVTFAAGNYYQSTLKMAPPITVTWNNNDITGSGNSFSKGGVTLTAGSIDFDEKNFMENGTFTTTLGNFTKIEVTAESIDVSKTGGWSGNYTKMTWTGNDSSVSFIGDIEGGGNGIKFVFTIEP